MTEQDVATTSSDDEICEIHAQYRGYGYVVTTRRGGDNRLHVEVSGCDRDGQVVVEVSAQVPVDELEVVARLLAGAARLHQPAPAGTPVREDDENTSRGPSGRYVMRPDGRAYTVEEKRQEHPNAYRAWTEDEEHELVRLHGEGAQVEELAHRLGRNPGGIRSRMIRLGLAERTAVAAEPAAPVEPAQ